tara:strand:+ start:335 stop:670 length:336 start_codon:yes stop_codon:yes gene_type:complete
MTNYSNSVGLQKLGSGFKMKCQAIPSAFKQDANAAKKTNPAAPLQDMKTQGNYTLENIKGSDFYTGMGDEEKGKEILNMINSGNYDTNDKTSGKLNVYRRAMLNKLKNEND